MYLLCIVTVQHAEPLIYSQTELQEQQPFVPRERDQPTPGRGGPARRAEAPGQ